MISTAETEEIAEVNETYKSQKHQQAVVRKGAAVRNLFTASECIKAKLREVDESPWTYYEVFLALVGEIHCASPDPKISL
jgi:hypothetical protein